MEHQQYNLPLPQNIPQVPNPDFQSAGNVLRTDKSLFIKDKFNVNDIEAHNKIGSKINLHIIQQADSATYNIQLTDFIIDISNAGVARTINLPKASLAGLGKVYIVKDSSGSISSTTITIDPDGTETINGDTSYVISTNFGSVGLYCNGSNWLTV